MNAEGSTMGRPELRWVDDIRETVDRNWIRHAEVRQGKRGKA